MRFLALFISGFSAGWEHPDISATPAAHTLHARVSYTVRMRHKLHIQFVRQVRLPMIRRPRNQNHSEENVRKDGCDRQRPQSAAVPALRGRRGLFRRQSELQRILCRTNCNAHHARAALR